MPAPWKRPNVSAPLTGGQQGETVDYFVDREELVGITPTLLQNEDTGAIQIHSDWPCQFYWLNNTDEETPSAEMIEAGSSFEISINNVDYSQQFTLPAGESYIHAIARLHQHGNVRTNRRTVAVSVAATLSNGNASSVGTTSADANVTTNLAGGTLYWGRYTAGATPDGEDISAGAGTGFLTGGNVPNPGIGAETVAQTGLTSNTGYVVGFVHDDGAGNLSNVVLIDFMTASSTSQAALTQIGSPLVSATASFTTEDTYDVSEVPDGAEIIFIGMYHDPASSSTAITVTALTVDSVGDAVDGTVIAPNEHTDTSRVIGIGAWRWTKTAGAASITFSFNNAGNVSHRCLFAGYLENDDLAAGLTDSDTATGTAATSVAGSLSSTLNGLTIAAAVTHGAGAADEVWSGGMTEVFGQQAGSTATRFSLATGNGTGSTMTPTCTSASSQSVLLLNAIAIPAS